MGVHLLQVRARCVARFRSLEQAGHLPLDVEQRIRNQYAPDLSSGWGLEAVQARPDAPLPPPVLPALHAGMGSSQHRTAAAVPWQAPCAGSCAQPALYGTLFFQF